AYASFWTHNQLAQRALQTLSFYETRLSAADSATFAPIEALHRVIASSNTPTDLADALRTIETDSVMANRVMAAMILVNFANRDEAWRALVDAQRDPTRVSSSASMALSVMSRHSPRPVD